MSGLVRYITLTFSLALFPASVLLACSSADLITLLTQRRQALERAETGLILLVDEVLSRPIAGLVALFEKQHPGVKVEREIAPAKICLRKVTELGRQADLVVLSDFVLAQEFLFPVHASLHVQFALDEMVLAYTAASRKQSQLDQSNWLAILEEPGTRFGLVEPAFDPAGYRSQLVLRLCDSFYGRDGRRPPSEALLAAAVPENRRPSVGALVQLLEAGGLDYVLVYRSLAQQLGLPFLRLPSAVNLGLGSFCTFPYEDYRKVEVEVPGRSRQRNLKVKGDRVTFALVPLTGAPHPVQTRNFIRLLLGDAARPIFLENGLAPAQLESTVQRALAGEVTPAATVPSAAAARPTTPASAPAAPCAVTTAAPRTSTLVP